MEKIEEYRHFIDFEVKKLFINSLKQAIRKIDRSKLGFVGIVDSIKEKQSHDIDILIFPNTNTKKAVCDFGFLSFGIVSYFGFSASNFVWLCSVQLLCHSGNYQNTRT